MDCILNDFLNHHNFRQAWAKVADNQGSSGIDRETIDKFAADEENNLVALLESVVNNTYTPKPLLQVLIPKDQQKFRELKIPTVRDRIVQQALLNVLYPITENIFSDSSFAYRPNLSYLDAIKKIAFWRDHGFLWVLDADIVTFFDSIDHQKLLLEVRKVIDNPRILCLIKAWITAGISNQQNTIALDRGIPQGAVISPLLSNVYLHQLDEYITKSDLKLVRYADDFVVLSDTEAKIRVAYTQVVQLLNIMGLKLNAEKTKITHFNKGFQFLGHGFFRSAVFPIDEKKESSRLNRKKKLTSRQQKK
ncbi:reverse transcriptase domain-containing protein [Gloeocapsa sp. PCC 73106]|uniref:reverse transcriptase domain-containing protein n=1 Tax=Gloeocapsa sp. PCC 73106 TaxID=102232 RepID=UPI0002ABFA0D|nr:reverse transcriptase domain-containing protein [Gloeocapsa sp. PCC 73106]ELR98432.1 Retron-type reverse transcriptase [Gloeocapsa sp. PCC 73106]